MSPLTARRVPREPLWRHLVGDVLRRERQRQGRTLKEVADAARISVPYLSEVERGLKEASSEVLAAAAAALGLRFADVLVLVHGELLAAAEHPVVLTSVVAAAPYGGVDHPAGTPGTVVALAA